MEYIIIYVFLIVERQAEQINMFKEGMWIEAKHVKRKDLHTYVSPSLLKKERKVWEIYSTYLNFILTLIIFVYIYILYKRIFLECLHIYYTREYKSIFYKQFNY